MARCPDSAPARWLALPPEPWKNGGGSTRTLAADGEARWRVSIADIDRGGPYSLFPGYERVSVVLSGQGVELRGEGPAVMLRPGEPAAFAGDAAYGCRLLGGPVRVLNLFLRRGAARAEVFVPGRTDAALPAGALAGPSDTVRLVLALGAGRAGGAQSPVALAAGEFVVLAAGGEARDAFIPAVCPAPDEAAAVVLDIGVAAPGLAGGSRAAETPARL